MNEYELWAEIESHYKEEMRKISDRVVQLMQEAIQETIYDVSDPFITMWERTNDFKNSVDVRYEEDGSLIVYINTDKLNYFSYVDYKKTDKEISGILPWLLEEGHSGNYGSGLYRKYPARHYLELAQEKIKQEFPELEIQIINEQPEWI